MTNTFSSLPAVELANTIGYLLEWIIQFFYGLTPAYILILFLMMCLAMLAYIFFAIKRIIENASK
jgi:hypothetical protein